MPNEAHIPSGGGDMEKRDSDSYKNLLHNISSSSPNISDKAEPNTGADKPINRRTIQFNLNEQKEYSILGESNDYMDELHKESLTPIVEILNQLKIEAKNKQRSLHKDKMHAAKKKHHTCFHKYLSKIKHAREPLLALRPKLYYFFERPVGFIGLLYRLFTFTIIIGSIITGALTTFQSMKKWSTVALYWYEIFATSYFGIEFLLRLWSSGHRTNQNGPNESLRFIFQPLMLVEISVLLISISVLKFGTLIPYYKTDNQMFDQDALLLLRFFQILRFLYFDRDAKSWKLVAKTIFKHKFELITSLYIGAVILLLSSYLILIFEKPYSDASGDLHFHTFADALYWSIITMATIGYGNFQCLLYAFSVDRRYNC